MNTDLHVIFGTGAIGLATLDALRHRGRTVRMVNRSGKAQVPKDVEVVAGDAANPVFAARAAEEAAVVYQTMNPPTTSGAPTSPHCRRACWRRRKAQAPGWSAWKTSTCTGALQDVR